MAPLLQFLLAVSAALSTVQALPLGGEQSRSIGNVCRDTTPQLPLSQIDNTGASPLPQSIGNLQYIQLGLGFQNYSCDAATSKYVTNIPSTGAIATLYDITKVVTPTTSDTITRNTLTAFETCLKSTKCSPSTSNNYCDACHRLAAAAFLPSQNGEHYFDQYNGVQTPNFQVHAQFLSAKKAGDVKAPANAYKGQNGLGAVDWLYLVPNASQRTRGLAGVYRVETAGGSAPASCSAPGSQLQVPYAAEYWFYA